MSSVCYVPSDYLGDERANHRSLIEGIFLTKAFMYHAKAFIINFQGLSEALESHSEAFFEGKLL
jgi:hypothetical protein